MHLRTPKRYSSRRRRRHVVSLRWLWLWILTPVVVLIGVAVYQNRADLQPRVSEFFDNMVESAGNEISTRRAPEPTPTEDPTNELVRANDAWARGSIEESVTLYREILPATPNDLAVHYRYTLGLIMQGQREMAVEAAANTVTANPFAPDAWSIQALAFNRTGEYGQGIASALQALQYASAAAVEENPGLMPARARALALLAEAYHGNGQYERAQSTVDQALELNPDSAEAYYVLGLLSQDRDFLLADARDNFAIAYDLAPGRIDYAERMARTDYALGNYDSMEATYSSILELNPANITALYWMGDYYFRVVGDPNQAMEFLNRCVRAKDDSSDCHYLLGRARMRDEQYIEALASFERALDLNDTNGYYFYWAAEAHINLLNCGAALTFLQTGYRIAQDAQDDLLIESFEASLQQCGSPVVAPPAEVTPEVEDTGTEGGA